MAWGSAAGVRPSFRWWAAAMPCCCMTWMGNACRPCWTTTWTLAGGVLPPDVAARPPQAATAAGTMAPRAASLSAGCIRGVEGSVGDAGGNALDVAQGLEDLVSVRLLRLDEPGVPLGEEVRGRALLQQPHPIGAGDAHAGGELRPDLAMGAKVLHRLPEGEDEPLDDVGVLGRPGIADVDRHQHRVLTGLLAPDVTDVADGTHGARLELADDHRIEQLDGVQAPPIERVDEEGRGAVLHLCVLDRIEPVVLHADEPEEGGGAAGRAAEEADPLALEVGEALDRGVLLHQHVVGEPVHRVDVGDPDPVLPEEGDREPGVEGDVEVTV